MARTDPRRVAETTSSEDYPDVCVITHPLGQAGENATRTLLEIIAAITSVRLVTADLPPNSAIRDRHALVELTEEGASQSNVVKAAIRFVFNQLRMCRAITGSDEEVVLFFGATAYLLPIVWARLLGRTVVLEPRGDVPLTLRLDWERRMPASVARGLAVPIWLLERIGYRIADAIVTYTPGMAAQLELERYERKLHTAGARYVDTDRFAPTTSFEKREPVVGFVGRIDEEKGIRALATVAKLLPPEVTFRFVGDGALFGWLQNELSEDIENGSVELAGWVPHEKIPEELNRLQLLVLPSSPTEGLPTSILEALACGTPVYATPVAGVPDVLREGKTGFLMHEREPTEIAQRIGRIIERSDLDDISENARAEIEADYDFDAAVDRYQHILQSVTE